MIIVCDVDGTIADHSHRFHHVTTDNPKNWKAYYEKMPLDPPMPGALRHLKRLIALSEGGFGFLTGRPEEYRQLTYDWILRHFGVATRPLDYGLHQHEVPLVMRPTGDFSKSHVFKESFIVHLRNTQRDDSLIFLDDDLRNAEMYSKYGLFLKAPECWEVMR